MKQAYFLLLLLTMIITSCGDQAATETSTSETGSTTDTTQVATTTTDIPEPKETYKTNSPYAEEIKLVEVEVGKIEAGLSTYTKSEHSVGENACQQIKLSNGDGVGVKSIVTCINGKASKEIWTYYYVALSKTDNKVVCTKYLKEEYNEADQSVKNTTNYISYTIGFLLEGEEHFGLVLDEKGNKVTEGLGEYMQQAEMMFISME